MFYEKARKSNMICWYYAFVLLLCGSFAHTMFVIITTVIITTALVGVNHGKKNTSVHHFSDILVVILLPLFGT